MGCLGHTEDPLQTMAIREDFICRISSIRIALLFVLPLTAEYFGLGAPADTAELVGRIFVRQFSFLPFLEWAAVILFVVAVMPAWVAGF